VTAIKRGRPVGGAGEEVRGDPWRFVVTEKCLLEGCSRKWKNELILDRLPVPKSPRGRNPSVGSMLPGIDYRRR
jgi:hypothetical protein